MVGSGGQGILIEIQMPSAAQSLTSRRWHRRVPWGDGWARPGFCAGRSQAPPSLRSLWPSAHWPPSSGREGVNLPASQRECGAINTHSQAGVPEQPPLEEPEEP